jgi:glycosyltransferase involved in cell wall biosynthesis
MTSPDTRADNREISDPLRLVANPRVSVVMVTYNHEAYLPEAIEGVLKQNTDFPVELLIGDDCSTDGTAAVALQAQRDNPEQIRVIASGANVGLPGNYARLIRASRAEVIAYCEGDDFWSDPGKLQRQIDYLRAHADTGAVHTDFDHILWRHGGWRRLTDFLRRRYRGKAVPEGDIFPVLLRGNFIQTCTLCFRADLARECLDQDGLKDSYSVNDWPLCLYIAAHSKIAYLPGSTAVYRKVPGSITNSGYAASARFLKGQIAMIEDVCDRFKVNRADRLDALAPLYHPLLSVALFAGDDEEFARVLTWLRANDSAYARSWRGLLLPWLARYSVSRHVMRRIQDARVRRREVREYR